MCRVLLKNPDTVSKSIFAKVTFLNLYQDPQISQPNHIISQFHLVPARRTKIILSKVNSR